MTAPLPEGFARYGFEYRHEGQWWVIDVIARDEGDAKSRISALAFARLRGRVVADIPVPGAGPLSWAARLRGQFSAIRAGRFALEVPMPGYGTKKGGKGGRKG